MPDKEVIDELKQLNDLLTRKISESPAVSSAEQVRKEMLLQARIKIQEAITALLRG